MVNLFRLLNIYVINPFLENKFSDLHKIILGFIIAFIVLFVIVDLWKNHFEKGKK